MPDRVRERPVAASAWDAGGSDGDFETGMSNLDRIAESPDSNSLQSLKFLFYFKDCKLKANTHGLSHISFTQRLF